MEMEMEMGAVAVDRISGLPDDLLHRILIGLDSAAQAARTSLLCRRWRGVWAHLPELSFSVLEPDAGAVDAALSAYSAPWLRRLAISVHPIPHGCHGVPAARAHEWLRFAARRLAGELDLSLCLLCPAPVAAGAEPEELVLPVLEGVTTMGIDIAMTLERRRFHPFKALLRLPGAGAGEFAALRFLRIDNARVVDEELGRVVSEQSPCLQELELHSVGMDQLCIRSNSLQRIALWSFRLERFVVAASPRLIYLQLKGCIVASASIAAPALSELFWDCFIEDDGHHATDASSSSSSIHIAEPHHLGRLDLATYWDQLWPDKPLLQSFDMVDELRFRVKGPFTKNCMDRYSFFMADTDKLPKAKLLQVEGLRGDQYGFAAILHLLRKCGGLHLKQLKLVMRRSIVHGDDRTDASACTYLPKDSWRTDNISLGSLQEIEINYFHGDDNLCAFLDLLFTGCKIIPKRLVISLCGSKPSAESTRRRIKRLACPYTNVVFLDRIPELTGI